MNNIWIMTLYTIREAMAKKVFIFFLSITLLALLILLAIFSIFDVTRLLKVVTTKENLDVLKEAVLSFELLIINPLANLCILLAIFSSASFIPSMLEKGNIDLLLSKPISRTELILGKYFGGVLVVFLNIFMLTFGVWLIISFKFGYWNPSFLLTSVLITFIFAILYAIIVLFGVITKAATGGMIFSYFIFLILSPLLYIAKSKLMPAVESEVMKQIINCSYYFFPKTSELGSVTLLSMANGNGISDFQPVITSLVFLILILLLSIVLFRKKDF